ncbi:hypothetical protein [Brachybacterium sp. ACRRE]|uniref:hypothetical protein n=1 Tax=Brachybacterium sp. ACRRE TaxID=2918184 RepID=UPI001EF16BB1|nr:hypothetical protein [Brachybacterium sp. ACRRE]MCG7308592.1 hypothetical protein [Brachybacterium sp. ACRRE]
MTAHEEPATGGEEPAESVLAVVSSHGDQEVLLVERDGRRMCRVRATTREERTRLRDVARLLAALGGDGARAAPRLLGEDAAGLLLEPHAPLRLGGGRRRAQPEEATPPTLERHALHDAREDLEALVSALHARGWVVGLAPGAGLGARPDGTVVISDLRSLRSDGSVGARMQDQHWLDSVLEDQGRTLRRRLDTLPGLPSAPTPGEAASAAPAPSSPPVPLAAPPPAWSEGWRARLARGTDPTEALASDEGILGAEALEHAPRRPSARSARGRRPARGRGGPTRHRGPRWSVPRLPRRGMVLAAAATVLVLGGGAAAVGAALVHREDPVPVGSAAPSETPAPSDAAPSDTASSDTASSPSADAPAAASAVIEDPRALVQELALGRHHYVTGRTETTVCAQGSPAAAQDDALRDAYQDVEVEGEGPVVTSAQIEQLDEQGGTARVRAALDQGELRLTTSDGAVVVRPAAGEQEVLLDLVREDGIWRVRAASAVEA